MEKEIRCYQVNREKTTIKYIIARIHKFPQQCSNWISHICQTRSSSTDQQADRSGQPAGQDQLHIQVWAFPEGSQVTGSKP